MKRIITIGLIITFLGCIISCDKDDNDINSSGNSIKIGVIFPFSLQGAEAILKARLNGIILARNEINSSGLLLGKKIELLVADNEGLDDKNIELTQALIDTGCVAIIGAASSHRTIEMAETITIPNNIVLISPTSSSPVISTLEDNDMVYRCIPSDAFQGTVAANYAFTEQQIKTASIIYIDNAYGIGLAEAFKNEFTNLGGVIGNYKSYENLPDYSTYDFSSLINLIVQNELELIYIVSYPVDGVKIVTTMHSLLNSGYSPKLIGCESLGYTDFLPPNTPAELVNGMIVLTPGIDEENQSLKNFQTNYFTLFNEEVSESGIYNSYDALYLLAYAMLNANSTDPTVFKDHIITIANDGEAIGVNEYAKAKALIEAGTDIDYNGVTGQLDFDENGDLSRATYLVLKIQDSKFIEIETIDYP